MNQEDSALERAAIVLARPDGTWEVQVSESEGTDGSRRWRHKRLFPSEQEAEAYARSILPYSDTAWSQKGDTSWLPEDSLPRVKQPAKNRVRKPGRVW